MLSGYLLFLSKTMNNELRKSTTQIFFSVGTLVALNVATVINIYGFPSEAVYGLSSITLYVVAIVIFLIPVALVSAELGSMFPREGGIYTWVCEAFSPRMGLIAIWLQWIQSVFFYPLSLTFAAVTLSYVIPDAIFASSLANNKFYVMMVILAMFWFATFMGTRGINNIGQFSKYSVWIGIFIPVFLLIIFGIIYLFSDSPIYINLDHPTLLPHFENLDQIVMAASIMLFFSGLEVNGAHVQMMRNPTTEYPKALFFTCLVIGVVFILGTLAVAIIIPTTQINITQSVVVAFQEYTNFFGIAAVMPFIAATLTLSVVVNTLTWITGPAVVLKYVTHQGYLPHIMQKENKHGAPVTILLIQAVIVTILALIYVVADQIQQGYQLLLQITNAIYLTMYIILFISFLRLRYTAPQLKRPFRVGSHNIAAWIVAIVGVCAAGISFLLCFLPPQQLRIANKGYYLMILIGIYLLLILPPFLFKKHR